MVSSVPEHLHTVTPSITCTPCQDAIAFYEHAFGAEVLGTPMTGPDGVVAHAEDPHRRQRDHAG